VTAASLVMLGVLLLGAAVCGIMLYVAYRPVPASLRAPPPSLTPFGERLEDQVEEALADCTEPALAVAVSARFAMRHGMSPDARRLLLLELLYDLRPTLAQHALHGPHGATVAIAHATWRRLEAVLGPEPARALCEEGLPEPGGSWPSGALAIWLARLRHDTAKTLGPERIDQMVEAAAQEVGRLQPLSSLPGLLDALPSHLLLSERTHAAARAVWSSQHAHAYAELDAARVRLADAELSKWASIGRMAAGVAHELNTPLTFLVGTTELLQEDLASPHPPPQSELREALDDVQMGLRQIRRIVGDLQTFSREGHTLESTWVDLGQLVRSTARMARSRLPCTVEVLVHAEGAPTVQADEQRIGQVLLNLIVNAGQARDDGHGRVVVTAGASAEEAWVEVCDDGPGVPADLAQRIFEPFFTTKAVGEGTGQGLAIARRIVESHDGRLELLPASTGARFRVTLQQRPPSDLDDPAARRPAATTPAPSSPPG
jgi:signal transduction histidine kinase